jgi:8-oxo-dGTP pyrophosphatase MutT (NUDIX family)
MTQTDRKPESASPTPVPASRWTSESVGPIPRAHRRGWRLRVWNDEQGEWQEMAPALLEAVHDRIGVVLSYGMGAQPEDFDRFVLRQPGGGGVVVVPYLETADGVYVGLIEEVRRLAGGPMWLLPRGVGDDGESAREAGRREFTEETGLPSSLGNRLHELPGKPMNPDPAFFEANPRRGEGVRFFGLPFRLEEVSIRRDTKVASRRIYTLVPLVPSTSGRSNQADDALSIRSRGLTFVHIDMLCHVSDSFTQIGAFRLELALRWGNDDRANIARISAEDRA